MCEFKVIYINSIREGSPVYHHTRGSAYIHLSHILVTDLSHVQCITNVCTSSSLLTYYKDPGFDAFKNSQNKKGQRKGWVGLYVMIEGK